MSTTSTPNATISLNFKKMLKKENLESFSFISLRELSVADSPHTMDQEEMEWYEIVINGMALSYLYPRKLSLIREYKLVSKENLQNSKKAIEQYLEYWDRTSVFLALNALRLQAPDQFFTAVDVLIQASDYAVKSTSTYPSY